MAQEPRPITELSEQALYGAMRYSFISREEYDAEIGRRGQSDEYFTLCEHGASANDDEPCEECLADQDAGFDSAMAGNK